jgi:nucleoredoxin
LDKDRSQFEEYYKEMPWLAVPFGDPRIKKLQEKFEPEGIPFLVITNEKEEVINDQAYEVVSSKREKAIDIFIK